MSSQTSNIIQYNTCNFFTNIIPASSTSVVIPSSRMPPCPHFHTIFTPKSITWLVCPPERVAGIESLSINPIKRSFNIFVCEANPEALKAK